MIVKLHLFAEAREIMGRDVIDFSVEDGATVKALKLLIAEQHPELEQLVLRSAISVQRKYAADDEQLFENAEIGIIPPVSGG